MSRPRYWWWKIAKAYVQVYPQLVRRVQEQEHTTMTASYRGMPGCFTAGRPVEDAAVRALVAGECAAYQSVRCAIAATASLSTGESRLKMIDLVSWAHTRTLIGAADEIGYSKDRVKEFHGDFIRMVGFYAGFITKQELYTKKFTPQSHKSGIK